MWNHALWKDVTVCLMLENLCSCVCLKLHFGTRLVGLKSRRSHYDKRVDCPAFQSERAAWILGSAGFIFSLFCKKDSPQLEWNSKVNLSGRSGIKWKLNVDTQSDSYTVHTLTGNIWNCEYWSPKMEEGFTWNMRWNHVWFYKLRHSSLNAHKCPYCTHWNASSPWYCKMQISASHKNRRWFIGWVIVFWHQLKVLGMMPRHVRRQQVSALKIPSAPLLNYLYMPEKINYPPPQD